MEDGFFCNLWDGLGLPQPYPEKRYEPAGWPELARVIGDRFATATRDEWAAKFAGKDACVTAVLDPDEVDRSQLGPVPRFSRTPGERGPGEGLPDATAEILTAAGLTGDEVRAIEAEAGVDSPFGIKWPPE